MLIGTPWGRPYPRVHLGTRGSYHAANAKFITDYGLFSADPDISEDFIKYSRTNRHGWKPANLKKPVLHLRCWWVIPLSMRSFCTKAGKRSYCVSVSPWLSVDGAKLYDASQSRRQNELILRSMCCLRPQIKACQEILQCSSVIGRF
jgi:polyphosphate kinase